MADKKEYFSTQQHTEEQIKQYFGNGKPKKSSPTDEQIKQYWDNEEPAKGNGEKDSAEEMQSKYFDE